MNAPADVITLPTRDRALPFSRILVGTESQGGAATIDLTRVLSGRLLIHGNSGAGKSMLLRRIFEEAFGKVQLLLIDVDGEFSTLADERDVAIVEAASVDRVGGGQAFAVHLREHRYSAVLDLSDAGSEERLAVVTDVLTGLIDAPQEHWRPLLVLIDEVQSLAPSYDTGEVDAVIRRRTAAALADVMGRGRKRGIAGVIATQRIAETSKAVVAKAANVIVGRTVFDRDLERAGALLGFTVGQAKALRTLADGEFVAIGPAIDGARRVRFRGLPASSVHKGAIPELISPPDIPADRVSAMLGELPSAANGSIASPPAAPRAHGNGRRGRPKRGFDAAEDRIIADGYRDKLQVRKIAANLEAAGFRRRSPSGISSRAQHLGYVSDKAARAWCDEEDQIIADGYQGEVKLMDIVGRLEAAGYSRGRVSVQMRAIHLGITRDRVNYWTEEETAIALTALNNGETNRDVIAKLKAAGYQRGLTAISKFAQKHNINRAHESWTPDELDVLRRRYADKTPCREIAIELGKTETAVRAKASILGLKQRTAWTDQERQILIDAQAAGDSLVEAAKRVGRPYPNVARVAATLQLDFRRDRKSNHAGGRPQDERAARASEAGVTPATRSTTVNAGG